MDNLAIEKMINTRNFQTQTHTLMKSTRVSKQEAISMIIHYLEARVDIYNEPIEDLLSDKVFLYKITYARKDAEKRFFKTRKRGEELKEMMRPLSTAEYTIDHREVVDKIEMVSKRAYTIFTKKTAPFVIFLLNHGKSETQHQYNLSNDQFWDRLRGITKRYIPNHRAEIDELLETEIYHSGRKKNDFIQKLIEAHAEEDVDNAIQQVIDNNRKMFEDLVGECNTPYIHKQRILIDDYKNADKKDKEALVRYLISIENKADA